MSATLTQTLEILEGLDPADVAGLLTNTRVPDAPCDVEQLRSLMLAEGLDTSALPAPAKPRPAVFDFAIACRSVETKRGKRGRRGERVAVGEVVTNDAESVYQVTRELVDADNRVIDHEKGMRVVYDKAMQPDPIRVEPFALEHYEVLKHLEDEIRMRFFALRGTIPGSKVREIVRKQFKAMSATRWSTTNSVWFAPTERVATLEAIERVLKAIYGDRAEFDSIPLPASPHTWRTVEQKVGGHVAGDADKLVAEIASKLADGADVRSATFDRMRDKAQEVRTYVEGMEAMLGTDVALARTSLALVDTQLMEMLARVKS